jgi:hypothetical protein
MNIVTVIDNIVNWLNANVCPQIKLKIPQNGNTAAYELRNPKAHGVYAPPIDSSDGGPPHLVVMPLTCSDAINNNSIDSIIPIYLDLMIWSPGTHLNSEGAETVDYSNDGWRDLGNLIDITRSELRNAGDINGLSIDLDKPIEFNLYSGIQTVNPEFGDFFRGFVKFTVKTSLNQFVEKHKDLL